MISCNALPRALGISYWKLVSGFLEHFETLCCIKLLTVLHTLLSSLIVCSSFWHPLSPSLFVSVSPAILIPLPLFLLSVVLKVQLHQVISVLLNILAGVKHKVFCANSRSKHKKGSKQQCKSIVTSASSLCFAPHIDRLESFTYSCSFLGQETRKTKRKFECVCLSMP